jgi:hypothetical protein
MSVTSILWEHKDFAGASSTSDSGTFRYFCNRYGSAQNDIPALPVADSKPSSSPFHVIGMTVEVGCRQVCL